MTIIRPRLNDFHGLPFTEVEVPFAIPFLDEDIPLHLDPFLLWKSPSLQDNSLHTALVNSFNHLGYLLSQDNEKEAIEILIQASECYEVGMGDSKTRKGKPIGKKKAIEILSLFKKIPQVEKSGFTHFEEIQLFVNHISKDRISDIACTILNSFLIDFTIEQCEKWGIPLKKSNVHVYDYKLNKFVKERVSLPINPETKQAIMLVPKRWLKYIPWINYDDYLENYYTKEILQATQDKPNRVEILNYNRHNYEVVTAYVKTKELRESEVHNDPLFNPIPVLSVKRKLSTILNLPTGKEDKADRKYEDNVSQLMASIVYPQLDFAKEQSRTVSGVLIRDLIFYNNRSYNFLKDIYDDYECRQIVFELKNVKELEREHIFQLNRYLSDQFGRFGVIVTRNQPPKKIYRNTIDLWSGQRKCIIILNDEDLKMMSLLFKSKQRNPIDVLKKKYIEFVRDCPS